MSHGNGIQGKAAAEEETRGNGIGERGTTDVEMIVIETHRLVIEIAVAPQDHRPTDSMTEKTTDERTTSGTTRNSTGNTIAIDGLL